MLHFGILLLIVRRERMKSNQKAPYFSLCVAQPSLLKTETCEYLLSITYLKN